MNDIIGQYINGNYNVTIYQNGTKIRENELDSLDPEFSESIDMKITDYCDLHCPFCHENSTTNGKHANFEDKWEMLSTIKPYTELAIGGGNPLSHENLEVFLRFCKDKKIICNMTVNIKHFITQYDYIKYLEGNGLIHGLGISVHDVKEEYIEKIKRFKNAVVHTIAGINSIDDYKMLAKNHLKVLILGYKNYRRGEDYINENPGINKNIEELSVSLKSFWEGFKIISFDNLALTQLKVKDMMPENIWNEFYMGDDGKYTFYVDLVNEKFAKNSTSKTVWDLGNDIVDMFKKVNGN